MIYKYSRTVDCILYLGIPSPHLRLAFISPMYVAHTHTPSLSPLPITTTQGTNGLAE